ncbi:MAG: transcription repressor NadR [Clostridia bacterium]|nr:transcription repressor NadR [Clostridia bacterium]
MNSDQRRKEILNKLNASYTPISATTFADTFGVTRQIIVADIALLRATGQPIRSEHKGYIIDKPDDSLIKRIVTKHDKAQVQDELYAIVDNGGKIIDVIVEHSVYDKITALLNLSSRYDVDQFVHKIQSTGANPLSILTEGLHTHTVSVKDQASYERILSALSNLNVLIEGE